jgi:hypothetical protein
MVLGFVLELAVGAAYAALGKNDPLAAAAAVVSGYSQAFPLTALETGCLYDLIAMRLCLSVVISAEQRKAEPANEYLSISEKPAWESLRQWKEVQPDFAHYVFRGACGLSPCPQSEALSSWLRNRSDEPGSAVAVDLEKSRPLLFDLSVGSPELGAWKDPQDMEELGALLFSRMGAEGAPAGIGRYGEARRFYTEDIFKTSARRAGMADRSPGDRPLRRAGHGRAGSPRRSCPELCE